MFDINESLNDVAPVSPKLLPVEMKVKEESDLLMDVICVFFLLSSPLISSSVSAVFDFNISLSDVAPSSPMLLSFSVKKKEKKE